jgi:hypothetical protein
MLIGVISDTHGLLRNEAVAALQGSDHIIHAGDVGDPAILRELNEIAPVTAVRGNVDRGRWARTLSEVSILEAGGVSIYVLHVLQKIDLKPEAAGFAAVVYGHSSYSQAGNEAWRPVLQSWQCRTEEISAAGNGGQTDSKKWKAAGQDSRTACVNPMVGRVELDLTA